MIKIKFIKSISFKSILFESQFIKHIMGICSICKWIFVLSFSMSACTHTAKISNQALYKASVDKTWEALVYIFKSYPIETIDIERRFIKTKILKDSNYWKTAHNKNQKTGHLSAVITVYLFDEKPYSRVEIQKTVFKQSNFFSDPQTIPSDLLEEQSLLYRLKREIYLRKSFKNL